MQAVGEMRDNFYDPQRGMVAYQDLKESAAYRAYRELAAGLDQLDPASLTGPAARRAFWINLYNSLVVHGIVELEIAASVREVAGFFRVISYRIGGRDFTPDAVEHGVLRGNRRPPYRLWPEFRPGDPRRALALPRLDPRLHFALVCGSRSCAPIKFYTAQGLDAELETAARNFVNSSEVVVLPERNKIMLSRIFQWYGRDFGGWPEIAKFLLRHLDPGPPAGYLAGHADTIRVEFLPYDWNLNRR
ncbi:MAG: DUF547 domain-containing protein [Deltaproteobacteria bacterium]|nr:DUF547 domain-containing protein [Deltaproteobacteria bacterium]